MGTFRGKRNIITLVVVTQQYTFVIMNQMYILNQCKKIIVCAIYLNEKLKTKEFLFTTPQKGKTNDQE